MCIAHLRYWRWYCENWKCLYPCEYAYFCDISRHAFCTQTQGNRYFRQKFVSYLYDHFYHYDNPNPYVMPSVYVPTASPTNVPKQYMTCLQKYATLRHRRQHPPKLQMRCNAMAYTTGTRCKNRIDSSKVFAAWHQLRNGPTLKLKHGRYYCRRHMGKEQKKARPLLTPPIFRICKKTRI
jgi:hypothetical protein